MKKSLCRFFCVVFVISFVVALHDVSAMEQGIDGYTFARCLQAVFACGSSCAIACALSSGGMNR